MYSICRCCCCYHNIVWIYFDKTFRPNPTFHAFSVPFKSRWTSWSIPSINSIWVFLYLIESVLVPNIGWNTSRLSIINNPNKWLNSRFKTWNAHDKDNYIYIYLDYIPSPMKMKSSRACLSYQVFFSPCKSSCIWI